MGGFFEGDGIVPAGATGAAFFAGFFKKDADGGGAAGEGGDDAAGEAVASGCADDQDTLRGAGDGAGFADVGDLFVDMSGTTGGVGGGADESANPGLNDHGGCLGGEMTGVNVNFRLAIAGFSIGGGEAGFGKWSHWLREE